MPLDEGCRALLESARAAGMPAIGSISAQQMRDYQRAVLARLAPGPEVGAVSDCAIPAPQGDIPVRVYRPAGPSLALMVYFHGGGWTIGSLDGWDAALRRLVQATGCTVASVDYRLAPEHRFPAAVEDALSAGRWALANTASIAGTRVPVVLAGDSAGGNLSAVLAQTLRDEGNHGIAAQVLIYPSTDGNIDSPAMTRFESPFLTREEIAWFYDQYIPTHGDRRDPRFAPLHAARLDALPPALVLTAENDLFCEEGEAYATRLRAAGVAARMRRYLGTFHGFFTMDRGLLPHSGQAMADIAAFLGEVLPQATQPR